MQYGYDLCRSKRTPLPHWMQCFLFGGGVMTQCCGRELEITRTPNGVWIHCESCGFCYKERDE